MSKESEMVGVVRSTVTSKGQITIPKPIRERLALRVGDQVEFRIVKAGTVTMSHADPPALGIVPGLLHHLARQRPVAVEGMDRAIGQHVTAADRRHNR